MMSKTFRTLAISLFMALAGFLPLQASYESIPFGSGKMTKLEQDYFEKAFSGQLEQNYFEVNLLDIEDSFRFRSHSVIECFKFLFYGFGEKYFFKITIDPFYQLDEYRKKPVIRMVFFHFSF